MRVLVCGGRDYGLVLELRETLDKLHAETPVALLIEGGATGADSLAREWSYLRRVPAQTFRANWSKHGTRAGPIRNQQMLDEGKPDMVVAFPGGRGTADMVRRAKAAGVRVLDVA